MMLPTETPSVKLGRLPQAIYWLEKDSAGQLRGFQVWACAQPDAAGAQNQANYDVGLTLPFTLALQEDTATAWSALQRHFVGLMPGCYRVEYLQAESEKGDDQQDRQEERKEDRQEKQKAKRKCENQSRWQSRPLERNGAEAGLLLQAFAEQAAVFACLRYLGPETARPQAQAQATGPAANGSGTLAAWLSVPENSLAEAATAERISCSARAQEQAQAVQQEIFAQLQKAIWRQLPAGPQTNALSLLLWLGLADRGLWSLERARRIAETDSAQDIAFKNFNYYSVSFPFFSIEEAGMAASIQAVPGRQGYWMVGLPPSGPMDFLHAAYANRLVGNPVSSPLIEACAVKFVLRSHCDTALAVAGMPCRVCIDGKEQAARFSGEAGGIWNLRAGARVEILPKEDGFRFYIAVCGGFRIPSVLGSASTFTLAKLGGWGGRFLRQGDLLPIAIGDIGVEIGMASEQSPEQSCACRSCLPTENAHLHDVFANYLKQSYAKRRILRLTLGPHSDAEFFEPDYLEEFLASSWRVHWNSDRTGIRLEGSKPRWARSDGGEAGLHPSNIHDNAYAIGTVDFTGDMPIILGPDGPSLGGFVCIGTVVSADLWKLGQLRPGDELRFQALSYDSALVLLEEQNSLLAEPLPAASESGLGSASAELEANAQTFAQRAVHMKSHCPSPILARSQEFTQSAGQPGYTIRQSGDSYLLVEIGPPILDMRLRFVVHQLWEYLRALALPGILDLTPGIRSLQLHFAPLVLRRDYLITLLREFLEAPSSQVQQTLPNRIVHLPLSWNDPSIQKAIDIYMRSVNPDAPWCPSNIEFIRRINGLTSVEAVRELVFSASYLVMGLGDVYLGAPVATPLDPRQRLVSTKYNPARTWTPQNAVGIGGAYMCIYGVEGPGGYQFVGRTLQIWDSEQRSPYFARPSLQPWLLRFFDEIRYFPVDHQELLEIREAFPRGAYPIRLEDSVFNLQKYQAFLEREEASIAAFRRVQRAAYQRERESWQV